MRLQRLTARLCWSTRLRRTWKMQRTGWWGWGLPVPTPTPEQVAASTALENSRGQYTLSKRAMGFIMHQADTVPASTTGAPPLEDAPLVSAATVTRKSIKTLQSAMNPALNKAPAEQAEPRASDACDRHRSTSGFACSTALTQRFLSRMCRLQQPARATRRQSPTCESSSPASSVVGGSSMGIEIVHPAPARRLQRQLLRRLRRFPVRPRVLLRRATTTAASSRLGRITQRRWPRLRSLQPRLR